MTIIAFAGFGWNIFDARRDTKIFRDRLSRIEELRGVIVHLDEVLTMSARMAVTTGDSRWEERYHHFEPKLDAAIKETIAIGVSPSDLKATTMLETANMRLVEMETRALALVHAGGKEEAQAVLLDNEYVTQKQTYGEAIRSFTDQIRREFDEDFRHDQRLDLLSIIAAMVVGGISFLAWLAAARGVRRWRVQLLDSFDRRAEAEESLRKAHSELEVRVEERTADLVKANETLQAEMSEHNRAEQALRESEARYRLLVDRSPDAIFVVSDDKIVFVNPATLALLGAERPEQLIGRAPSEIVHPEDRAAVAARSKAVAEGKQAPASERRMLRLDGSTIEVESRMTSFSLDGKPAAQVILRDITDRKRAEEELHWKTALLQAQVDSDLDGMLVVDEQGKQILRNERFNTIWKIPSNVSEGADDQKTLEFAVNQTKNPKEFIERVSDLYSHPDDIGRDEIELIDGSILDRYSSPVRDKSGKHYGRIWTFRDITKRKRSERDLADAKGKLQSVLDAATQVSIIATDTEGLITVFNSGAEQMLGYSAKEIVGKQEPTIIHLKSEVVARQRELTDLFNRPFSDFDVFVEYARQGKTEEREWTYVRKDGGQLTVSLVVTTLRDANNDLTGFLGVAKDITLRKRAEEELLEAKEAAEAATRAKSEFLATMSHEIRTPMNGVIGMTNLLLDSELSDEQRHRAEAISKSGESLLSIINDILDFSKIEAGKLVFETLDFSFYEAIDGCLEFLAQSAQAKHLELSCLIESNVPEQLCGDPVRLCQVLTNLVSNAIKFTECGDVAVRVSLEGETDTDVLLRFEIKDTGIGLSAEVKERLFQPFTQADASMSRKFGGTGLGLAISKQLVEVMQGQIGVESTVGRGAVFWFTVKLARQPASSRQYGRSSAPDDLEKASWTTNPTPLRKEELRILLAEDNLVNQEVAQGLLLKLGHRTETAANGREALEALRRSHYDVILMDCQMPELDGYETTRRIRQLERQCVAPFDFKKPVHIIAMTAHAMRGNREECLRAGMNDYLRKPVRDNELRAALNRCILSEANSSGEEIVGFTPNESSSGEPVLDTNRLRDVANNEPVRMRRLINLYLDQTAPLLEDLNIAIETNSSGDVARLAHKLAGSSVSCGVEAFTQPLRELERLGHEGDLTQAPTLFENIRGEFPNVRSAFGRFLQTIPGDS